MTNFYAFVENTAQWTEQELVALVLTMGHRPYGDATARTPDEIAPEYAGMQRAHEHTHTEQRHAASDHALAGLGHKEIGAHGGTGAVCEPGHKVFELRHIHFGCILAHPHAWSSTRKDAAAFA